MIQGRRVGVFAAMSLDGYLAGKDDNLEFLDGVQDPDEDYGYGAFASRVVGYEVVKELCEGEFPHVGRWPIFVVTHQAAAMPATEGVEFGTLEELPAWLGQRVAPTEGDEVVWCDGGGQVISALSEHIDEWTLSVVPSLLGDGIRLFPGGRPPVALTCSGAMSYSRGLVQMRYVKAQD
jgi:dihydrofolate reductase